MFWRRENMFHFGISGVLTKQRTVKGNVFWRNRLHEMYLSRCEKPSGYKIFKVHKRKGVFTQESLFRKVCLDRWMTTVSETAVLLLCEGSLTLVLFVSRKLLESSEWGIRRVCVGGISSPVAGTVTAVEITFCLNHFCTLFSLNSLLRKPCDWVLIIHHQHDIQSFLAPTWLQCFHRASYFLVLQHSFKKGTSWEYLMFVSLFAFQHFTKAFSVETERFYWYFHITIQFSVMLVTKCNTLVSVWQ